MSCRPPGAPDAPCRPLASPRQHLPDPAAPNSSCEAAAGYCDVFDWCRSCRERGPLATVHRLLFTGEGRADLLNWLRYRWWAVLVVVVGLVVVLSVTVRCFAVPTPSSNPRRPPAGLTVAPPDGPCLGWACPLPAR